MTTGQHKVALTFDFDTITNWLANGRTSPTPISRGEFGLVGAQRLLTLLERFVTAVAAVAESEERSGA